MPNHEEDGTVIYSHLTRLDDVRLDGCPWSIRVTLPGEGVVISNMDRTPAGFGLTVTAESEIIVDGVHWLDQVTSVIERYHNAEMFSPSGDEIETWELEANEARVQDNLKDVSDEDLATETERRAKGKPASPGGGPP